MCTKNHFLSVVVLVSLLMGLTCLTSSTSAVGPFGQNDFTTTYVGNTAPGSSTHEDGFVQQRIIGFYTHPDGTSFASCRWEEGGRNIGIYNANGDPAGHGASMFGKGGFGVVASQNNIYALGRRDMGSSDFGVHKLQRNGTHESFTTVRTGSGWTEPHLRGIAIDETAVGGIRNNIYVANHHEGYVRVFDFNMNVQRNLSITDPWGVAVADDGNLWVVQPSLNRAAKFSALNGSYMGAEITGLIDPGPIGVCNNNNVWVFDRDPSRHQFLIFSQSGGSASSPMDTFGVAGGVWTATTAGQTGTATVPGEVHPLKFNYATGIAFDSSNNIYIGGDGVPIEGNDEGSGAWMRKFNSSRNHVWTKYGLEFLDVCDADRSTDAVHLYTKHEHFVMDWNQPAGQEQTYKGYTLDPFAYPRDWRKWYGWKTIEGLDPDDWEYRITGQFDAMVRMLPDDQGDLHRFLYVGDQDASGRAIYRFEEGSEIAIPCVTIRKDYPYETYQYEDPPGSGQMHWGYVAKWYHWRDENGDGQGDGKVNQIDLSEVEFSESRGGVWGWWVDQKGNIWTGDKDGRVCEYKFMGINSAGAPIYPTRPTKEWPAPIDFDPNGTTRGEIARICYLEETDTLYLGGYPVGKPAAEGDWGGLGREIIRYDNWTSENTTKRYAIDDLFYEFTGDAGTSTVVKSMDMVGDIVIYGYVHDLALRGYDHGSKKGRLEVYNHLTKQKLGTLLPDSNIGYNSWIETPRSFNAVLRDSGEYQVYVTDEAQAKVVIYRMGMWSKPAVPAAPTSLSAVNYRDKQANLSWNDNASDENGFVVEASTDGGSTYKFMQGCGQNVTSVKVRGLTPATTYMFRVCARNTGGKSAYTNTVTITTDGELELLTGTSFGQGIPYGDPPDPDAPNGYKAAYDGNLDSYVDLIDDWASDGYAGLDLGASKEIWRVRFLQRIKRPDRLLGGKFQGSNTGPDATDYVDLHTITRENLMPVDGWYYVDFDSTPSYRYVRYYSAPGGCCNISEVEFYTEPTVVTPPTAPENLGVATVSDTELQVTWTDMSTNETGFRVERITDGYSFNVGQNIESYIDPNLSPSTSYTYRVVAYNIYETPCVNPTQATGTTSDPLPPAPPSGLVGTPDDGRAYLNWTASVDPDTLYYKVYRSTTQGSGHTCVAVAFGGTNIVDSQVVNETVYYYYLTAVDTYGQESLTGSNEVSVTPHVLATPDAPSSLAANASSYNQIDLSWVDNADNETGFRIERKTTGDFAILVDLPGTNITSYNDTGLTAETTYTYRVFAYNNDGDSPSSNEASDTTPQAPAPNAPSNLTATAGEGNWITLEWQDNSDNELGFRIERKTTGAFAEVATVGENVQNRTDTGLDPDTTYTYRVRAYNATGDSAYSNEDSATTPAATGPVLVDDADAAVTYSGNWTAQSGWSGRINGTLHETNQNGAYTELTFTGTSIKLIADKQQWGGTADVIIDTTLQGSVSFQSVDPNQYQQVIYEKTGMANVSHTIRIEKTGGDWIYIDAFEYQAETTVTLPPPWDQDDVGTVGVAGSAIATGGDTFTINGSGYDIWYDHDAFHYVYQPDDGDVEIIARIESQTNTNEWAKSGLMIRETLDEDAEFAFVGITPSHGSQFVYRNSTAGSANEGGTAAGTAPMWYKLNRTGNVVTGSYSTNGVNWTQIGSWTFTGLSSNAYVGMAVCSHDDLVLCEAQFSNVSVNTNP